MTRLGIFGWGVVAPRSPDVDAFADNLESAETWLTPFEGFGPTTFLVGEPDFRFEDYRHWIDERFPPNKFPQLQKKMGSSTQYAIGAFVQSLQQNPGIETTLRELGLETEVLVGTGLGDLPTQYDCSVGLYRAQLRWDRFWATAERNSDRRRYEEAELADRERLREQWGIPTDPRQAPAADLPEANSRDGGGGFGSPCEERERELSEWNAFWMRRSDGLRSFLEEFNRIEGEGVSGAVESGKLSLIRRKKSAQQQLEKRWGCPSPPWMAVSSNLLWNISNIPAAQISMLGQITGPAYAPNGACAAFGLAVELALRSIRGGNAKAVVVGMADPRPHPLSVGAFYRARVLAADRNPSVPLTNLRGTHVAGGACIWILGDYDFMTAQGYEPLGLEILGVGLSSDADHIITPSEKGPREAIRKALENTGIDAEQIGTWDLHSTATPGDYQEVSNLRDILPNSVAITARKGTFGHGMAVGGGWELTAQHIGFSNGHLFPTLLTQDLLNDRIESVPFRYVLNVPYPVAKPVAGKLSMGVGGINSCVISRRWEDAVRSDR